MLTPSMRRPSYLVLASVLVGAIGALAAGTRSADPLAAEVERWSQYLKANTSNDEMWLQIKEGSGPAMARVESAMKDGRRLLALQRLAAVVPNLESAEYLTSLSPEARRSDEAFEAAWKAAGKELSADLRAPSPSALQGFVPAAVRGVGEASLAQVRVFYDASLEYERNTMPDSGYFYLGLAKAQRDFAAFCRSLSKSTGTRPPPLRSLRPELDALEGELLAAYRPPASIDKHPDFIGASAAVKEARELDAAGLAYGATLRYLQASLRAAPLTGKAPAMAKEDAARKLAEMEPRLADREGGVDQSLGRIFLEAAQADVASAAASNESPAQAAAIVTSVLPRYFAALEPARPAKSRPSAEVTVTLVRWPYT
jgi:hypothetical protein